MDLLQRAATGFATLDADAILKDEALRHLGRWLTEEPFVGYRPQLAWLIDSAQWAGLLDRFCRVLPFGTGGRRGAVGVGPNRMNPWTLAASVQGHCEYLRERFPAVAPLTVVLAWDVRRFEDARGQYNPALPNPVRHLTSRDLARHAAGVYAANGIHAHLLPEASRRYIATPELSFTIRLLKAHGGLNISASHNPPDDNGAKFYDERGGQPIPPDDQIMADLVDQVAVLKELPWTEAARSGRVHVLDEGPHRAYVELIRRQSLVAPPRLDEVRLVFTPLHGVGAQTALEALEAQGFRVAAVEEQMTPDGAFPNVTETPNPEVPASMDRAGALAESLGADLVLATDPDADRLGALAPDAAGVFQPITGNALAALLTHFKLARLSARGELPARPIVITTLVTTGLVTRVARAFGAQVVNDLLVGFKYVAEVLAQLEQHGCWGEIEGTPEDFIIASEESHGILVTPALRDKDAAGAALLLAELALDQKRQGGTVLGYLDNLHRRFGYFHNALHTLVLPGVEGRTRMARLLDRLRAAPPGELAGLPVTRLEDLQDEEGRLGPLKGATDQAARNFLSFTLGDSARLALRPSGTEPKAKVYIEVSTPPRSARQPEEAWRRQCTEADALGARLAETFLRLCKE